VSTSRNGASRAVAAAALNNSTESSGSLNKAVKIANKKVETTGFRNNRAKKEKFLTDAKSNSSYISRNSIVAKRSEKHWQ